MAKYVEVHLREGETLSWFGRPLYHGVVQLLWESGAPGITVFRGEEGLDRQGHVQNIHSEYLSDSLPITLHMVVEGEDVLQPMLERIRTLLQKHDSLMFTTDVKNVKGFNANTRTQGVSEMELGSSLKVYMKEEDRYRNIPLYHALVQELKKRDILWVNVQRALEGFGTDHVIRKNKIFEFASHSPVLVEVACSTQRMDELVRELQPLLQSASGPAIVISGQLISAGKQG